MLKVCKNGLQYETLGHRQRCEFHAIGKPKIELAGRISDQQTLLCCQKMLSGTQMSTEIRIQTNNCLIKILAF